MSKSTDITQEQQTNPNEGLFSRMQRTAGSIKDQGLNYFNSTRPQQASSQPSASLPATPNATETSTTRAPSQNADGAVKATTLGRFGNTGKTKKDGDLVFPPPHWSDSKESTGTQVPEGVQPGIPSPSPDAPSAHPAEPAPQNSSNPQNSSDPDTLARRIQALLSNTSLPFLNSSSAETASHGSASEPHAPGPQDHSALPPVANSEAQPHVASNTPPVLTSDAELISLLSSPDVMNGKQADGKGDGMATKGCSVWDALERLTVQVPWVSSRPGTSRVDKGKGRASSLELDELAVSEEKETEDVLEDDDSGVMVYGPLFPSTDPAAASEVELAKSELVSVHPSGSGSPVTGEQTGPPPSQPDKIDAIKEKLQGMWPFAKPEASQEELDNLKRTSTLSTSRVHFQPLKHEHRKRRVWVPSRDMISVQIMWWGYRIYLPPPVLAQLDNTQLESAKRAALLTTALKYVLDRIPLTLVPLQARPALRLFKAFTPYLGYVGGFVALSWGAVKGFDKGHGITLSATWLLTVAVIPGTYEANDLPDLQTDEGGERRGNEQDGIQAKVDKGKAPPPLPARLAAKGR